MAAPLGGRPLVCSRVPAPRPPPLRPCSPACPLCPGDSEALRWVSGGAGHEEASPWGPRRGVLPCTPRQRVHADSAAPGVQGRARPASSPWAAVFTADQCPSPSVSDLCPVRRLPALLPAAFASRGGSAAAGPGPGLEGSAVRGRGLVRGAGRLQRGAVGSCVAPALGDRVGGGAVGPSLGPSGTGCRRPLGPPGSSDDEAVTLTASASVPVVCVRVLTPFPAPSAPCPGRPQLLRRLPMGSGP